MRYTLEEISSIVRPIAIKYSLPAVWIFGSYARGEASEDSDLDLLVDTAGTQIRSLISLGALYNDLSAAFDVPVDLVTVNSLTQHAAMPSDERFREAVLREKVAVYGAA